MTTETMTTTIDWSRDTADDIHMLATQPLTRNGHSDVDATNHYFKMTPTLLTPH